MSRSSSPRRGRGRPRRAYRIRVVGERRAEPDYDKLARALLEHAAMQARTVDADDTTADELDTPSTDDAEAGS